ncbi:hypothetical protein JAAARDRAFT_38168, partial [Jaapia argillacea MUCL 33604]
MPPRRQQSQKAKAVNADADLEEILQLSQQSASSDDAGLVAFVTQHYQASVEKKKKEKEAKFIQWVNQELDKCLSQHMQRFAKNVEEMNAAYEGFTMEYAAAEDEIRSIWSQILNEQRKLLVHVEEKVKVSLEANTEREEGHVEGLVSAKSACEDMSRLIVSLNPSK